jgi:hypothetical protein
MKRMELIASKWLQSGSSGYSAMGVGSIPIENLKTKYAVPDSEFIAINGVNIHYKDEGKGPVLLLLHGICASLYTWDGWASELKKHYRIIRLDLPGWGLTGPIGEASVNLNKMMGFISDFLKALDLTIRSLKNTL